MRPLAMVEFDTDVRPDEDADEPSSSFTGEETPSRGMV